MIAENGARTVHTTITAGKMTIFPAGSVHTMANRGTAVTCSCYTYLPCAIHPSIIPSRSGTFRKAPLHATMPSSRFASIVADTSIECTNTQLVSALNSDDSGTHNIANALFSLPNGILQAAFGYYQFDMNGTAASIPAVGTGSASGTKECLARCRGEGFKV